MKDYDRIAKKITLVLFLSQSLSSAGFIAAFTVNALVGVDLTGQPAMAGVPGALYVVGQACGAMVWGFSMERISVGSGLQYRNFRSEAFRLFRKRLEKRGGRC